MLQIIQFPHPIWEDPATIQGMKPWNNKEHKRNFIVSAGEAISRKGGKPERFESISFWGEWEPEANVVKTFNSAKSPITPRRLIAPVYPEKAPNIHSGNCCANTDPFVFGEHFKYSNCRQYYRGMPNRLQDLSAGSLILYGGVSKGDFWLDTVFVVKDGTKFNKANYQSLQSVLKADYPLFESATLKPLFASPNDKAYTLYRGQNYWENDKFFSFVPCDVNGRAFAKVRLTRNDIARLSACFQNYTVLGEKNAANPQSVWNKIVDIVLSQNLSLGVRFDNIVKKTR